MIPYKSINGSYQADKRGAPKMSILFDSRFLQEGHMGSASSFTLEELLPSADVASAADFDDEAAFDSYKVKLTENRFFKLPHLTITNIRIHSNN